MLGHSWKAIIPLLTKRDLVVKRDGEQRAGVRGSTCWYRLARLPRRSLLDAIIADGDFDPVVNSQVVSAHWEMDSTSSVMEADRARLRQLWEVRMVETTAPVRQRRGVACVDGQECLRPKSLATKMRCLTRTSKITY
jgi:hypothetical protein